MTPTLLASPSDTLSSLDATDERTPPQTPEAPEAVRDLYLPCPFPPTPTPRRSEFPTPRRVRRPQVVYLTRESDGHRHATTRIPDRTTDHAAETTQTIDESTHGEAWARGDFRWNDRGAFYYERVRKKCALPALVATGRHAGRSMVRMRSRNLIGLWFVDMFTSLVEMRWRYLILFIASLYLVSFVLFAAAWYALHAASPTCLNGFEAVDAADAFNAALQLSVETQTTIGYGGKSVNAGCRTATLVLILQCLVGVFVDALCLGLIFARITDPKHRTRSVFVSDAACIATRDGALTFMFRVADVRDRKVIAPVVRASLYTWQGRRTAEGEHLPVTCQSMEINHRDELMLLPITIEHVIDEKSPLYHHTHESLVACGAEVVVSLEGCIDTTGLSFSARQSYLPNEILWGHTFVRVIRRAGPGERHHQWSLRRFHELEPQRLLETDACVAHCGVQRGGRALLTAQQMCEVTLEHAKNGGRDAVPFPAIGTNTLVLSDVATLNVTRDRGLVLSFRVGDSRSPCGCQVTGVEAIATVHRWRPGGARHSQFPLAIGIGGGGATATGDAGPCRLSLWTPVLVEHVIDDASPLREALVDAWPLTRGGHLDQGVNAREAPPPSRAQLAPDAEIVVVVEGTLLSGGNPVARKRVYRARDLRVGHEFAPIVEPPERRRLFAEPSVDFTQFHATIRGA